MGVKACGRTNCTNIMCDRCILDGTMYICNACYQEFCSAKDDWPVKMTKNELKSRIRKFMKTEPGEYCLLSEEEISKEIDRLMGTPYQD